MQFRLQACRNNAQVWGLLVGYLGALCFWWSPQTEGYLRALSPAVWLSVVCHLATVAGIWRVPILAALLLLLATGFLAELRGDTDGEHGRWNSTEWIAQA